MKGARGDVAKPDALPAEELTVINQYMVEAEMCANWGCDKLHAVMRKQAITEMKHAENLIEPILFLDGRPTVSKLNAIVLDTKWTPYFRALCHPVPQHNFFGSYAEPAGRGPRSSHS